MASALVCHRRRVASDTEVEAEGAGMGLPGFRPDDADVAVPRRKWVVRVHCDRILDGQIVDRIYAVRIFYTGDDERDQRMARDYALAPTKEGARGAGWPDDITYTELAYTVDVERFHIAGRGEPR
jgi:hypothetical protein